MLVHSLFYVPTISITNSIAFASLKDPQKDFGPVRLWGTIGWIAASWPFVFILADWAQVPAFGSVSFTEWLGKALGTSKTGAALQQATTYTFIAAGGASENRRTADKKPAWWRYSIDRPADNWMHDDGRSKPGKVDKLVAREAASLLCFVTCCGI